MGRWYYRRAKHYNMPAWVSVFYMAFDILSILGLSCMLADLQDISLQGTLVSHQLLGRCGGDATDLLNSLEEKYSYLIRLESLPIFMIDTSFISSSVNCWGKKKAKANLLALMLLSSVSTGHRGGVISSAVRIGIEFMKPSLGLQIGGLVFQKRCTHANCAVKWHPLKPAGAAGCLELLKIRI